MKKIELLLPITFNDGTSVPNATTYRYLNEIYDVCGGITLLGTVVGAYKMKSGEKQVDRSVHIWAVVDHKQLEKLRKLVRKIGKELGQESMYFETSQSEIEFLQ